MATDPRRAVAAFTPLMLAPLMLAPVMLAPVMLAPVMLAPVMLALLMLGCPATGFAQRADTEPAAPLPAEARASHFLTVGVAAGSPGYANLTASYFFSRTALRLTAGAGGRGRTGVQGDVVWRFVREANLSVGVALAGGTFTSREPSADNVAGTGDLRRQVYLGAALDVFYGGFHLQTGLAHGFRDYPPNKQLLSQFGYEWRIR